MPESPEVRIMSRFLNERFANKVCESVNVNSKSKHFKDRKLFSSSVELEILDELTSDDLGFRIDKNAIKFTRLERRSYSNSIDCF